MAASERAAGAGGRADERVSSLHLQTRSPAAQKEKEKEKEGYGLSRVDAFKRTTDDVRERNQR